MPIHLHWMGFDAADASALYTIRTDEERWNERLAWLVVWWVDRWSGDRVGRTSSKVLICKMIKCSSFYVSVPLSIP